MSVLPLVIIPDNRLLLCSEEVRTTDSRKELQKLIEDMFETMYTKKGIGLAAVQVGVHKRIFVIDIGKEEYSKYDEDDEKPDGYAPVCGPTVVMNPQILEKSKEVIKMPEGCLSVPEQREVVTRPKRIVMQYLDWNGEQRVIMARGLLARCLQHEIDHLNGTIFLKHLSKLKRDLIVERVKKASKRE